MQTENHSCLNISFERQVTAAHGSEHIIIIFIMLIIVIIICQYK